jgi:hypothetical protein
MYNKFIIDTYVEKMASISSIKSFTPNSLSKALDIPLPFAIERLNKLVEDAKLILKYEIRCDNADLIEIVDEFSNLIGKDIYCKICDGDIEVSFENIFPIYYFDESYREHLKKKIVPFSILKLKETLKQEVASARY